MPAWKQQELQLIYYRHFLFLELYNITTFLSLICTIHNLAFCLLNFKKLFYNVNESLAISWDRKSTKFLLIIGIPPISPAALFVIHEMLIARRFQMEGIDHDMLQPNIPSLLAGNIQLVFLLTSSFLLIIMHLPIFLKVFTSIKSKILS